MPYSSCGNILLEVSLSLSYMQQCNSQVNWNAQLQYFLVCASHFLLSLASLLHAINIAVECQLKWIPREEKLWKRKYIIS